MPFGVDIPSAQEIAKLTTEAMQPMQDEIASLGDRLDRLIEIQTAVAVSQGVKFGVDGRVA